MRINSRMVAVAAFLFAVLPAAADWSPGDTFKMHYPQLPDPQGWDVNFTFPQFLADDWLCTETGPVSDVHFWFSWERDIPVPIESIHLSIHSDIPAGPNAPFSRPGDLLWQAEFLPTQPNVLLRPYGSGPQGWYDPKNLIAVQPDHFAFYQANIVDIPQPFIQQLGTVYWLDISVRLLPGTISQIGWKTSVNHFNDDAVWGHFVGPPAPIDWHELRDPFTGESLDLAFVITPEPSVLVLIVVGGLIAQRGRQR